MRGNYGENIFALLFSLNMISTVNDISMKPLQNSNGNSATAAAAIPHKLRKFHVFCPPPSRCGIGYTVPTCCPAEAPLATPPPPDMHVLNGPSWSLVASERRTRMVMAPARPKSHAITATPTVGPAAAVMSELFT